MLVPRCLDEEPILNETFLMQQINGLCVTTGSQLSVIPENWERQKHTRYTSKRNFTVQFSNSNKNFCVVFNNFSKNKTTQNGPAGTQQFYGRLNAGRGTKRKIGPTTILTLQKRPKTYGWNQNTSESNIYFNKQIQFLSNVKNLFKNNEIFISHEDYKILKKIYPKRKDFAEMGRLIAEFIHTNNIEYPYLNYNLAKASRSFRQLTDVKIDFWNLIEEGPFDFRRFYSDMNYDPTKKETNPFYGLYIVRKKAGGAVAEWVIEKIRLSCGKTSPVKIWYSERLGQTCVGILSCDSPITMSRLRGLVERSSKRCANFRPTNVLAIISLLEKKCGLNTENGIHVLDTSAGFAGRLVGCIADPRIRSYTGIDPNEKLHPQYQKIADTFSKITNTETYFICKPSEEVTESDWPHQHKFDLLIASLPYYDNEKYTNDSTQSWVRYIKNTPDRETGERAWREKYLYPTLYKAWKRLKDGGFFALNVGDVINCEKHREKKRQICKPMIEDFIIPKLRMKYMGCIGIVMKRTKVGAVGEPVWIFQKSHPNSEIPVQITSEKNVESIVNLKKEYELLRSQNKQIPFEWWRKLQKYLIEQFKTGVQPDWHKLRNYFGMMNGELKPLFNTDKMFSETSKQSTQNNEMTNSLKTIKRKFEEFRGQRFKNAHYPNELWKAVSLYYIQQVRQGLKPRPIIRELQSAIGIGSVSITNHIDKLIDGNIYDVDNSATWSLNGL